MITYSLRTGCFSNGPDLIRPTCQQWRILTQLLGSKRIVKTDVIVFDLWGFNPPKDWRDTVVTLVSKLRRFLDGSPYRIVNCHGFGYKMERS